MRRRRYSEEVYAERRKLKGAVIPDLIRRDFSAMEPRRRFVEDITYLPALEGTDVSGQHSGPVQCGDSGVGHLGPS